MNIVLVGMMGSGKSTVGCKLAGALGRPFIDTDTLVERYAGLLIRQIFATEGEAGFRRREAEAVAEAAAGDNQVIATGGGAVVRPENRAALRRTGLVFWLDAPAEELYERSQRQGVAVRPLLAGADPLGTLSKLAAERAEYYALAAHHRIVVAGLTPEAVAAAIRTIVDAHEGD